jgi:hypothetical protein
MRRGPRHERATRADDNQAMSTAEDTFDGAL